MENMQKGSSENVSDADSEDIFNMIGDADSLDADILGLGKRKSSPKRGSNPNKKVTFAAQNEHPGGSLKTSSSMDSLFSNPSKKEPVSQSPGLDDLFGPTPSRKQNQPTSKAAAPLSTSKLDDLFGPTPPRRPPTAPSATQSELKKPSASQSEAKTRRKNPTDWLGLGNDSSEESDNAFQSAISKRKPNEEKENKRLPFLETAERTREEPNNPKKSSPAAPSADLPFLNRKQPTTVAHDAQLSYANPRMEESRAPYSQPPAGRFDPDMQQQMKIFTAQQQDALKSLQDENSRLRQDLNDVKSRTNEEIAAVVREWKAKCDNVKMDADEEINKIRDKHKRDLDRMEEDCEESIRRVKEVMGRELETATHAYQQTRSFHDLTSQMGTAIDQLESVGAKVVVLQTKNEDMLDYELKAKEERVSKLQARLDQELSDVQMEKEKLHTLLTKLQISADDQEKLVSQDRQQFLEVRKKFEIEKEAFETDRAKILERLRVSDEKLTDLKQSLFSEHQQMLHKLLMEQEKLQEERVSFQVHRDHDLARIRKEALLLEERSRAVEISHREALQSKDNFETRQKRLLELEQVMHDERTEIQQSKYDLELERTKLRMMEQDMELSKKHMQVVKQQTESKLETETHKAEALKFEAMKKERILQERSDDLVAKQREFLRQYTQLAEQKRNINKNTFTLEPLGDKNRMAERPYDSPVLSRVGSVRSTIRSHLHTLADIVKEQDEFVKDDQ